MKILFYIEPWIELQNPIWRRDWFVNFSKIIEWWLIESKKLIPINSYNIKFICSDSYTQKLSLNNKYSSIDYVAISQKELSSVANGYKQFHLNILKEKKILEATNKLIKSKLVGFVPDIVITTTENDFLKKIFPNSLILLLEVGIFSQFPYPISIYFDTEVNISKSYIKRYCKQLLRIQLAKKEKKLLAETRKHFLKIFNSNNNPFKERLLHLKKKLSRLVILALQPSNIAMTFKHCSFESQFDYMMHILNNLDKDIGIIVTEHRLEKILHPELIEYLKNNYSNFIYLEELDYYENTSQLLLPFVDGVITTASTVGWQAVFYQKYLFVLSNAHISAFSDANNIKDINKCLKNSKKTKNKDGALYHLFTRYWINFVYVVDPKWVFSFLDKSLKRYKENKIDYDFYDFIDDPKIIFQRMIDHKHPDIFKKKPVPLINHNQVSNGKNVSRMNKPLKRKDVLIIILFIFILYFVTKLF